MKHHFADFLDREGDYWTIIPNRERYAFSADKEIKAKDSVKIMTLTKDDRCWKQVFDFPNLEELTLHMPSKEQVESLHKLPQITRLRITHLRTKTIDFLSNLINLEELVLEYVSGFSDLSPLRELKKVKSLHFENLRSVKNFEGLQGMSSLKYLHINGTLDWNQPIENFDFLEGLPNLEVFSLGWITCKSDFPAFISLLKLKNLKRIAIGRATLTTKEYAFLETALPNVEGASWELCWKYDDWFDFLGKGAGRAKSTTANAKEKCDDFKAKYELLKKEAEVVLKKIS